MSRRLVRVIALGILAGLAACSPEHPRQPLGPPALEVTAGGVVSGSVVSGSGNVCDSLPSGARLAVVVIDLGLQRFAGSRTLTCPANSYSFSVAAGTYVLRVQLTPDAATASGFPWRTITMPPVEVTDGAVVRDLPVTRGTPLQGGATIDGAPVEGEALVLAYGQAPGFAAAQMTTGPDGVWADFFGRSPALLQSGIQVQPSIQCDALGGLLVTRPRTSEFLFPDEASGITCGFTEAPAVQFSHTRTRLVVTAAPGDIGGTGLDLAPQLGWGWGVQFPVNPGERPRHGVISVSQLFMGGLVIGIRPDRVLSGIDLANGECGPVCHDLGLDGRAQVTSSPQFGTKVTWHYSDATSSEGVGLKVVQKSYDGVPPADYVLFRFTIKNSATAPLTFYAGMFADWDIDDDFVDDVGATDLDGRLMYVTNEGGGVAAGSLILSDAPASGNAFLGPFGHPTDAFVSAMAGDFSNPSADTPDDQRYVHAVGPITLAAGAQTDVWIAIVAGDDRVQLLRNAAAAAADVANRRNGGNTTEAMAPEGTAAETVILKRGAPATRSTPICKRGCVPARLQ